MKVTTLFRRGGPVCLFLILIVFSVAVRAEERVLSFEVTAALQSDASMIVTERIRVNIEHKIIRHGLTHAFPIKELYDGRKLRHYGFELLDVRLDGRKVNFYQSNLGYYSALAIGREGVAAPLGDHVYEIVYKTSGHVRPQEDRDEIYYNVMGPGWELPVDSISFTLELPGGGTDGFIETAAYTGAPGESGGDYVLEGPGTVRTTRPLEPDEGLTVAMAWERGLVNSPEESRANIVGAHRPAALWGLLAVTVLYFTAVRFIFGRTPKGVAMPLFSPPEGMSPGYAASLKSMAYQGRMLHADIVWAAVSGFFRLDARDKSKIILHKEEAPARPAHLKSGGEWARKQCADLTAELFWGGRKSLDLRSREDQGRASGAFDYLMRKYSARQKGLWSRNYISLIPGILLFLWLFNWIMQYISSPMLDLGEDYGGAVGYLAIIGTVFFLIGGGLYAVGRATRMYQGWGRLGVLALASFLILGLLAVLWVLSAEDWFFLSIMAACLGLISWFCFNVPGRLSPLGREQYQKIQGLEMYISTAETHRLAQLNAPEDTVEKFEELLPYAIALNCAEAWRKRFDKVFLETDYNPQWLENDAARTISYKRALTAVAGSGGMAAAARACAKLSRAARASQTSNSASGSSRSGGGSGFRGGSSGGGSGGSRVGGW